MIYLLRLQRLLAQCGGCRRAAAPQHSGITDPQAVGCSHSSSSIRDGDISSNSSSATMNSNIHAHLLLLGSHLLY